MDPTNEVKRVSITMTPRIQAIKEHLKSYYAIVTVIGYGITADVVGVMLENRFPLICARDWFACAVSDTEYLIRLPDQLADIGDGLLEKVVLGGQICGIRRWRVLDGSFQPDLGYTALILLEKFPLCCWEDSGFRQLVSVFGILLDVDPRNYTREKLDYARLKVTCKDASAIPSVVWVETAGVWHRVKIHIEEQLHDEDLALDDHNFSAGASSYAMHDAMQTNGYPIMNRVSSVRIAPAISRSLPSQIHVPVTPLDSIPSDLHKIIAGFVSDAFSKLNFGAMIRDALWGSRYGGCSTSSGLEANSAHGQRAFLINGGIERGTNTSHEGESSNYCSICSLPLSTR